MAKNPDIENIVSGVLPQYVEENANAEANAGDQHETETVDNNVASNFAIDADTWLRLADACCDVAEAVAESQLRRVGATEKVLQGIKFSQSERIVIGQASWLVFRKHVKLAQWAPEIVLAAALAQWLFRVRYAYVILAKRESGLQIDKNSDNRPHGDGQDDAPLQNNTSGSS